jgi:hypothetical protein
MGSFCLLRLCCLRTQAIALLTTVCGQEATLLEVSGLGDVLNGPENGLQCVCAGSDALSPRDLATMLASCAGLSGIPRLLRFNTHCSLVMSRFGD